MIDGYSRLAWVEVLERKGALDVMFATLKAFNILHFRYGIDIDAVMSDNGSEFGGGRYSKTKASHPFERLLLEMDIRHKYTCLTGLRRTARYSVFGGHWRRTFWRVLCMKI